MTGCQSLPTRLLYVYDSYVVSSSIAIENQVSESDVSLSLDTAYRSTFLSAVLQLGRLDRVLTRVELV